MAYGYLKHPIPQHPNIKIPIKIYGGDSNKMLVFSSISSKSFEVNTSNLTNMYSPEDPDNSYTVNLETINTQPYYIGRNSLYKFAEEWKLNSWEFDICKRVIRARHKGNFKEDLEKTKNVIDIYLKEYEGYNQN